jgi:HSP20 family protein
MTRNLVRFDPFAGLTSLGDGFFDDGLFTPRRRAAAPTTDVYTEDDQRLVVETHLPDFAEADVSVDVDRGTLVIQAEKHEQEKDKNKKYVVRESSSSFYRSIALPEKADEAAINATFDKGVLRVTIPFTATPSPKKIEIKSAPTIATGS